MKKDLKNFNKVVSQIFIIMIKTLLKNKNSIELILRTNYYQQTIEKMLLKKNTNINKKRMNMKKNLKIMNSIIKCNPMILF